MAPATLSTGAQGKPARSTFIALGRMPVSERTGLQLERAGHSIRIWLTHEPGTYSDEPNSLRG
jgi:hypothetical protein